MMSKFHFFILAILHGDNEKTNNAFRRDYAIESTHGLGYETFVRAMLSLARARDTRPRWGGGIGWECRNRLEQFPPRLLAMQDC
jgi:hypothetical protein